MIMKWVKGVGTVGLYLRMELEMSDSTSLAWEFRIFEINNVLRETFVLCQL